MAWTAADINRISQGTNSRKKQWTAEAVQKVSKGTNNAQQATQPAAAEKTLYETAFDEYRANNNLGLAEEADRQSDWLRGGPSQALRASSPEGRAIGRTGLALLDEQSPTGRESAGSAVRPSSRVEALSAAAKYGVPMSTNVLEQVGSGAADYGDGLAQKLKASYAPYSQKDEFDRLNEWFDTDDNRNLADAVRRVDNTHGAYTDADLIRNGGWTQAQIDEARQKNAAYDALPAWQKTARRAGNIIGGIADSVAGGAVMAGETAVQSAKNIAATQQNWARVRQEIKGDARAEKLFQLLTDVDMDYKPVYPESRNRDLVQMGYGSEEIRNMRDRLAGLEVNDSVDPETSVGYQLHKRGQDLTGAAQSGLTDGSRAVQGAVSSAAENLAVAAVNPAAVLPVLSLQGAGDAMGQSIEKGESAGKTLAGGALKFGAGWAINSVGAADLAKTMGSDYAKDTVAGQIAEKLQSLVGDAPFAKAHPTVAAALSGGIDNAMQAFVETYADKAIDAALGDEEAAQSMFTTDTLIAALESGLSGGASGAMGGAVGSVLAKYNDGNASWLGQAEYYDQLDRYEKAGAAEKKRQLRVEEPTLSGASRQLSQGESYWQDRKAVLDEQGPMEREQAGFATEGSVKEQTAVNDDPAVHTAAQNASIEEYKNSVDPKLAEYVDRVRAGEKLAPYVVSETSGRMRSAMLELTGLSKVGDCTLMDANAVQHITNRHAGGDGSADATMKESADVARAAYVLNNFDNAYLAKDRAKGYKDSRGKRAPIVVFEKKIDGSHIVVEAVCDTKKNYNYIVSEYLSKNGVDEKEMVKALRSPVNAVADPGDNARNVVAGTSTVTEAQQAPMDAASDPRHTSETFSAHSSATAEELQPSMDAASSPRDTSETLSDLPSAETSIAPESTGVNGRGVGKAGETVETLSGASRQLSQGESHWQSGKAVLNEQSSSAQKSEGFATEGSEYADLELKVDPAGLDAADWNRSEQKAAARELVDRAQMSTRAAQAVVDAMPIGIGATVYTQAANSLYRMGVAQDVKTFEQALELTGSGSLGGATGQVMALGEVGENALRIAYTYGKGEAEAYYVGDTVRSGQSADDAFIELGAKSSGTAVHRMMEGLKSGAKGFLQTAAGRIYLAGEAGSETMMHETFHALNEWSPETGQAVMDRLLKYLVEANGMESTEKLVQSYLDRYAASGQKVTYNQALEEVTADAMETVFGDAESFRSFVRQQAAEARMNAQARGAIGKVMEKIENLLQTVLRDVEHFLKKEPTNAAAKAARSLTEEQLRDLRELYFEHQAEAGTKYREALAENKTAPSETKEAAVKYSIVQNESGESYVKIDEDILKDVPQKEWKAVVKQAIKERYPNGFERNGWTILNHKDGRNEFVRSKSTMMLQRSNEGIYTDKMRMAANLDEIIQIADEIYREPANHKNAEAFNRGKIDIQVGQNFYEADVLTAIKTDGREIFYDIVNITPVNNKALSRTHMESNDSGSSLREGFIEPFGGTHVESEDSRSRLPKGSTDTSTQLPKAVRSSLAETQEVSSISNIAQESAESKENVKYQLDVDADAVDAAKSGLGNVAEQTETIRNAVEAGGNKRVSDEGLENIAKAVKSDTKSRIDGKTLTERLRGLSAYLSGSKNVNWEDAHAFVLDMAEQIMLKSSRRNDTLWKQHPELHEMGMKVEKGSTAFQELVYRYGSWANAKRELGRHGVKITQLPEGQHSRWDADFTELQKLGAGLFPDEVPNSAADALEAMANAHDIIKPVMENAFDEDWEGAKQDIALQIWQRYLASPELANAESAKLRDELNQQWTEMRQQAKQEALEARAKAQLRLADKQQKNAQWASRELAKRTEQEKARRDAQIDKVRAAREADNTRRSIRRLTTQITQSLTGDKAGKNVPEYLADKVQTVAVLANEVIGNDKALAKLGGKLDREMSNLQRGIEKQMSMSDRAGMEWQNSGIDEMAADWLSDVDASRTAALDRVNKEIERAQKRLDALKKSAEKTGKDYASDEADMKAYLAHLKMQRMEYENGGMARMTIEQLRGLREILEQTVYLVQNENKLLGEAERAELDTFATGMRDELRSAKGLNFEDGLLGTMSQKTAGYKLNTMGIQRQFERMGGYQHGGCMEKAGQMLNQGQYKRTRLLVEGTRFFDNVTGEKNLKNMDRFTHELVDIGLKTDDGRTWKITREQAVALYFQAQNMQGLHHMTHGGLKILNMEYAVKGDRERALHDAQTIRIGDLKFDEEGHILNREGVPANEAEVMQRMGQQRTTLLAELEKVLFEGDMADYCKAWIDDYKEYGKFTKQHINETSMVLNGRAKAQVENYIPLRVDEDTRKTENTGIQYDNSVGSEGFLKSRVNSSKPIWLDGIGGVVNTSLENVAQYAGMAIPLRNMQKLLNTQIDGRNIHAEIRSAWGTDGSKYMEKALADLYPQKGKAADYGDGAMAKLRSAAAGAVLTANLNVTLLQAASLPTAAAELGWGSTGHAAVQFARNVDPVNKLLSAVGLTENSLKKVEAEIMEHGDVLLQYRLRGTQNGELGTMGEVKSLLGKAHDAALSGSILTRGGVKFLDAIAGSITKMDEITVAALWNGAKDYVVKNPTEFDADAQQKGSAAYWDAVNRQFQRTVERTQPNYTPMQRTGMQRSSNQALKFLMMYSTQRQQNCQIVVAAAEDRAAQARRYREQPTAENKDALKTAKKRLNRAITSQAAAAGVISAMGIFVKYLLHRRKDLEDENGDITLKSLGKRFLWGMVESLASNPVGGSEVWSAVSVVKNGSDYDALSVSGLSNLNDFIAQVSSQMKRIRKDTSEMDEAELKQYTDSVKRGYLDIVGAAMSLRGVPYTNVMKIVDAAGAYWDDWVNEGTLLTTSDTPSSATGQYDRLFNAIESGDAEEVQGATKKLAQMLKEGKIKEDKTESQLGSRLKKYDPDILAAAEAQNAGKPEDRKDAKQEVFDRLCTAYGVKKQGEKGETDEDKTQRKWFIALIDKAVKEKAEELLKGGSGGSVYDQMKSALDGGTASDVQSEIDRLLKAGKESSNIKTEVTKAVREEYLAGSDHDREKLAAMLLRLEADGEPLYEEKNFDKWVQDDKKKQEKAAGTVDEWASVR